jgi:hypothetical protein
MKRIHVTLSLDPGVWNRTKRRLPPNSYSRFVESLLIRELEASALKADPEVT